MRVELVLEGDHDDVHAAPGAITDVRGDLENEGECVGVKVNYFYVSLRSLTLGHKLAFDDKLTFPMLVLSNAASISSSTKKGAGW